VAVSIYMPHMFTANDDGAIARLIREYPFATLITPGETEPVISHLPLELVADEGPQGTLLGHMARANPHWQRLAAQASVAVFHGPHAYVSPSWYLEPATAVPTWNYAVVHVHGTAALISESGEKRELLDRLVGRYEGGRIRPWHLQLEGRPLEAMLGAIVGFRLRIERIDAKFKFSQNRSAEDRDRVVAALRGEKHADASSTAAWMESYARER
jgi:transcriptional regulator